MRRKRFFVTDKLIIVMEPNRKPQKRFFKGCRAFIKTTRLAVAVFASVLPCAVAAQNTETDVNDSQKGMVNNALDVINGKTAGVNVGTNGLDRMAMLNSVRVRGTTSILGGNDPLVIIDGVTSDIATLSILPTSRASRC